MTVTPRGLNFGRLVFAVAAVASGLITLAWHDYNVALLYLWNAGRGGALVYVAAAAQIVGGVAIAFRRTEKTGAIILGAVYLLFAVLYVPRIVATPQIYDRWGNFFEQLSLVSGAIAVYARSSSAVGGDTLTRVARILLGVCAASFGLEQAFYFDATASLVPKWLPPSQTFWAVMTTVSFALAAVALLTNRMALLATVLLTLMIVLFGLSIWVPLTILDPQSHTNWGENIETFAIAGAAWIVADLLAANRLTRRREL